MDRHRIIRMAQEQSEFLVMQRRYLHQHPYVSIHEEETTRYLLKQIASFRHADCRRCGHHGLLVSIKGELPGPCILFRADFDALNVKEETGKPYASIFEDRMHACGHDCHTAILLGLLQSMDAHADLLRGEVRFLFQDNEEIIPGGAQAMIADGCLDGGTRIYGLHVDNEIPVGQIGICPGPYMAGSARFNIELSGIGGHGGTPFSTTKLIDAAVDIIGHIHALPARFFKPTEEIIINTCYVHGGNEYNISPSELMLGGTVRFYDEGQTSAVQEKIIHELDTTCAYYGAKYKLLYDVGYPPLVNSERESKVVSLASKLLEIPCVQLQKTQVSEDFARYLQHVPGAFFRLGIANYEKGICYPLHSSKFDVDELALTYALEIFWTVYLIETEQLST